MQNPLREQRKIGRTIGWDRGVLEPMVALPAATQLIAWPRRPGEAEDPITGKHLADLTESHLATAAPGQTGPGDGQCRYADDEHAAESDNACAAEYEAPIAHQDAPSVASDTQTPIAPNRMQLTK